MTGRKFSAILGLIFDCLTFKETLMRAFFVPDSHGKAASFPADPYTFIADAEERLILSVFSQM